MILQGKAENVFKFYFLSEHIPWYVSDSIQAEAQLFNMMTYMYAKCIFHSFQIEKAKHCQFLLVYGEDDQMAGIHHAKKITERLKEHGCTNYKLLTYPGAGHLLEPPYTPLSSVTYHKLFSKFHFIFL